MMRNRLLASIAMVSFPLLSPAADWTWQLSTAPGAATPTASICEWKYGKTWAYGLEIDDAPASTLTKAMPLLAAYSYTDAPPGVSGGTSKPFVGGVGVIVRRTQTLNTSFLSWDQIRTLQSNGWGVINHGYAHLGLYAPDHILAPDARRELFWSQAILKAETGGTTGRITSHFVYPNGDMGYKPYLTEFGIQSATRVGGGDKYLSNGNAYASNADWLDLSRSYLDNEGKLWGSDTNPNPMYTFPAANTLTAGKAFIDFTHRMGENAANASLWNQRLSTIATTYGKGGLDNMWSAPSGDIYEYAAARKQATVTTAAGKVTLHLPDTAPGAALTLKLTGISASTPLTAPIGSLMYRQGDTVWITTPTISDPGPDLNQPKVECIYRGTMKDLTFDKSVTLAAVRVLQFGAVKSGYQLQLDALTSSGTTSLVPAGGQTLADDWGNWRLYDLLPGATGIAATGLDVSTDPALREMEVWAVAPVPEPVSLAIPLVGGLILAQRRRK